MSRLLLLLMLCLAPLAAPAAVTCRLVSGGSLGFGSYDFFSPAPNDSLANVTVSCSRDGGPQNNTLLMRVDQGLNGASVNARRLRHTGGSGDTLAYGLYRDVGRTNAWGTTDSVDTLSVNLSISNNSTALATFIIYGRIPAGQDVSAGTYRDTVGVTLIY
ncbi:spore coat U domain-containing protein [Ramlibacter sp. PS3R-8]|uniref:Csu type fimbrial protein n=1 Tax=Ramlibacter sp. PS3R-8 TaxID=3133437 RepID=UPI0030B5EC89